MNGFGNSAALFQTMKTLRSFFIKADDSSPDEAAAELAQSKVRFAIFLIVVAYIAIASIIVSPVNEIEPWAKSLLIYYCFYQVVSVGIYVLVRTLPGHYPARRLLAMINDYVALGFSIIANCPVMIPIYAVIVWITVGNGMRYGRRYLYIASMFAQVTLATVFLMTPHLQDSPGLMVTLSLTALIVPIYASVLLREIEVAKKAAESASTAKTRFLAQASHDLRQPLHAMSLFLFNLQQTGLNAAQNTIVDRIDRSLQGVSRLFRSLLDVSTLDSGSITPNTEPVSLEELLSEIVYQNAQLAAWGGTKLSFVKTSHCVRTDRALLATMIQNLISNALKFAEGRKVVVGCRRRGRTIAIQVWDSGDGIAENHISNLFDEFYQVKRSSDPDRQGVGLGLSIVLRMAGLLKLKVDVASQPGKGSVFTIGNLPLFSSTERPAPHSTRRTAASHIAGLKIALVEDDPDVLAATKEMLDVWGCRTAAFTRNPEQTHDLDLVITDYDLGEGRTGMDCIDEIRAQCGWPVPAIIVTGHDENRITDEVGDPAICILKKPVRAAELRSAIGAARAFSKQEPNLRTPLAS